MLLLIHIISAIASLVVTSIALFRPSARKLTACYALASAALISGVSMIATSEASILKSCIAGISYFVVVTVSIAVVHRKVRALVNI